MATKKNNAQVNGVNNAAAAEAQVAAPEAKNETKSPKTVSENSFTMTGRLVKDVVTNESKSFARFTLAHNFGKDMDALFTDVVAFAKNGKKDVDIPFDILVKGAKIRVSGFMRPNNHEYNGKKYYSTDFVALTIEPAKLAE